MIADYYCRDVIFPTNSCSKLAAVDVFLLLMSFKWDTRTPSLLLATAERPFLFAAKEGDDDEILSQVPEVAGA